MENLKHGVIIPENVQMNASFPFTEILEAVVNVLTGERAMAYISEDQVNRAFKIIVGERLEPKETTIVTRAQQLCGICYSNGVLVKNAPGSGYELYRKEALPS